MEALKIKKNLTELEKSILAQAAQAAGLTEDEWIELHLKAKLYEDALKSESQPAA